MGVVRCMLDFLDGAAKNGSRKVHTKELMAKMLKN